MRLFLILFFCAAIADCVYAQTSATGIPYFQQGVHYTLNATFNDDFASPSIDGTGQLEYTNNSPDTLHELYFHLYWNLFRNGSYGESAPNRDHSADSKYGHGGIDIKSLNVAFFGNQTGDVSSGIIDTHTILDVDNTILRVRFSNELLPGGRVIVSFDWHGILPNYGIRSTWGWHDNGARNFSTAQWYPQVCVYDNHGWHPDQYIGMGEFYTDYGSFDVSLTLPQRFSTVSTTGWLANPRDVLPDSVRSQLAYAKSHPDSIVRIADYSDYHSSSISKDELMRTWKFHADSVRDFAWCADEAYIWDAVYDNGIMHNALYWDNSREFWSREAAKIELLTIQTNSKFAGQYIYPNIFMCETYEGGMEYPGIVYIGPYNNGTREHWPQTTMMHELGHEWYPMMMGSNETDYGYMDEGFNTFITTFVQEKYFGRWNNAYGPGLGYNDDERTSNYRSALLQQLSGNQEPSKQKADMYYSYRDYADATYPHTSTVFFMLRYTMGDTAFADFMKLYYERWRFKHPYPDDLLNAAEDIERREGDTNRVRARGDLRWFFNEWFEQTWKLDYAIGHFYVDSNSATITIERKERAVMPIDIVFTFKDGTTEQKWISVDDWLRTVADERTYTYAFDKQPVSAVINPSLELLDINRLNNTSSWLPPLDVSSIPKIFGDVKPIDKYALRLTPSLLPTGDFTGWNLGLTELGSYLDRTDRLAVGILSFIAPMTHPSDAALVQYHTVLDRLSPWTDFDAFVVETLSQFKLDPLQAQSKPGFGFQFSTRVSQIVVVPGSTIPKLIFNAGYDLTLGTLPNVANVAQSVFGQIIPLNRAFAGYTFHDESAINTFTFNTQLESGLGDPRTTYTKIAGLVDDRLDITHDWNAFIRLFGGSMQPIGGSIPPEAEFQLASASEVDQVGELYGANFGSGVRAQIQNAATLGPLVRGYLLNGNSVGRVAASGSFELGNRSLFPLSFLGDIPYIGKVFDMFGLSLFGDAGLITNTFNTSNLRSELQSDAGLGLRFFGVGSSHRVLNLDLDKSEMQLDFPLYLDKPGSGESNLQFRCIVMVRQNF